MRLQIALALGMLCAAGTAHAQVTPKIDLPNDSPVGLLSVDFSKSSVSPRGGTNVVDVSGSLSLRNASGKRIRGITLAVYAQDVTPGGKASVSKTSLDVSPGETFSVQIENRLLRPLGSVGGGIVPTVEVKLDGVLFDDLSFYGPDTLSSKSTMTVWELQSRRERKYFREVLESAGKEGLRKEMNSLAQQDVQRRPGAQLGVQMVRGRITNAEPEQQMQFAFVQMPDSPLEPLTGMARVSSQEVRAPRFSVRNRSSRAIDHFEIAWIVKDQNQHSQATREFFAASMPADVKLAPNQTGEVPLQNSALRFQEPLSIQGITGFVSSVAFSDGEYWIPSRASLANNKLRELLPASPEEMHLLQIFNRRGLNALVEELKK